jgi:hypothetical protein
MTQTRETQAAGVLAARIGLVVGGLVCLAVTPQFALAYFRAYGAAEGEIANGWIEQVDWPTWVSGLNAISTYKRYGVIFGFALAVVVISLGVVVRSRISGLSSGIAKKGIQYDRATQGVWRVRTPYLRFRRHRFLHP